MSTLLISFLYFLFLFLFLAYLLKSKRREYSDCGCDNGVITTEEVQEAISSWLTDTPIDGHTLTTEEVQILVSMWLSS